MDIRRARECDMNIIKEMFDLYKGRDIPVELTKQIQITKFSVHTNEKNVDEYLKAIRQDIRKIFLIVSEIEKLFDSESEDNCENSQIMALLIEYIFSKYRSILEYVYQIADLVLEISYSRNNLKDYEKYNEILAFLKKNVQEEEKKKVLNTKWFSDIRKTRNSIIHNGATCIVFSDKKELMFQIYDLDTKELVIDKNMYLHNGNCIYFGYFVVLNISYLFYFINIVFSLIAQTGEINLELETMFKLACPEKGISEHILQDMYMKLVKNIIDEYVNSKA